MSRMALWILSVAACALGCSGGGSTGERPGTGGGEAQAGGGVENVGGGSSGSAGVANVTCGAQTCGADQFCCGPVDCSFCAPLDAGVFCGFACENGGSGGSSTGGTAGAGGGVNSDPDCMKPAGTAVAAADYSLAGSKGCSANVALGAASITIADEATFRATFNCPADGSSGIDFTKQRLRVTTFPSFAMQLRKWAVEDDQGVHVGYDKPPVCGGAFPPSVAHFTLLPAGPKPVEDDLCDGRCNLGAGGFPP